MSVFRLDPIEPNDASWALSTVCETVWTKANDPWTARQLVAARALQSMRSQPDQAPPLSPWQNDYLTTCVIETSRISVPNGKVVRADGSEIGGN